MKIKNTQARLYNCSFVHDGQINGKIDRISLPPGETELPNDLIKGFLAHPGVKAKIDLGYLKIIGGTKAIKSNAPKDKKPEDKKPEGESSEGK